MNEQEKFWAKTYATDYIQKNSAFDHEGGVTAWRRMLKKAENIQTILECGCNVGRNIDFLNATHPAAKKAIIEISEPAYRQVTQRHEFLESFNGSIIESNLTNRYDLVFTSGVLIHVHPQYLIENLNKIAGYSNRYVLLAEYFSRTPVAIRYQGQDDKLFKSDFGKTFLSNFSFTCIDYGFLWGHYYDAAGFDDITWWLFEKTETTRN